MLNKTEHQQQKKCPHKQQKKNTLCITLEKLMWVFTCRIRTANRATLEMRAKCKVGSQHDHEVPI